MRAGSPGRGGRADSSLVHRSYLFLVTFLLSQSFSIFTAGARSTGRHPFVDPQPKTRGPGSPLTYRNSAV